MARQHHPVIHIAVADEQHIVREGICQLIASYGGFAIDIEASDGEELLRKLRRARTLPDICMFDILMPRKNGYDTLKEIRAQWPQMKVLIFTMVDEEQAIRYMLKKSVNGFLAKECAAGELKKALVSINETGYYHSEIILKNMHDIINSRDRRNKTVSDREMAFLSLCCKGYDYKKIGAMMNVGTRTVQGYQDSFAAKVNKRTRAEITGGSIVDRLIC